MQLNYIDIEKQFKIIRLINLKKRAVKNGEKKSEE